MLHSSAITLLIQISDFIGKRKEMIKVEIRLLIVMLAVIILASFYKGIDAQDNSQLETNSNYSNMSLVLGFK